MLIENDTDHEAALARIEELWYAVPGTSKHEEFMVLVLLVEAFEAEKYPMTGHGQ